MTKEIKIPERMWIDKDALSKWLDMIMFPYLEARNSHGLEKVPFKYIKSDGPIYKSPKDGKEIRIPTWRLCVKIPAMAVVDMWGLFDEPAADIFIDMIFGAVIDEIQAKIDDKAYKNPLVVLHGIKAYYPEKEIKNGEEQWNYPLFVRYKIVDEQQEETENVGKTVADSLSAN